MNIDRFKLFFSEFFNCDVKNHFCFSTKEGKEEHVFLLEDDTEVVIRESDKS